MASASPALVGSHRGAGGGRGAHAGWLYGPAVDLLCGYGVGYLLTVPLLLYVALGLDVSGWPTWLALLLALAISTPHYGATLLRVYERRQDRQKYAIFAFHFSALIALAFAVGLYRPWIGSLLVTVYATWSPWHFAGQNYGLALMSLRRKGVEINLVFKRLLYLSFVLSFVLAVLSIHVEQSSVLYAQGTDDVSNTYEVMRAGIPRSLAGILAPLLGVAYVGCLAGAIFALRRRATPADLVPSAVLVLTQALWFAVPALAEVAGSYSMRWLPFSAVWISAGHSLQYLWVTAYYAKRSESSKRAVPFLTKAMLAGCAISLFPLMFFVPGLLGSQIPPHAAVGVLLFAVLNIHHFVLDGAIWKLRDGRVARVLLRTDELASPEAVTRADGERHWGRRFVWVAGFFSLVVFPAYVWWEIWSGRSSADLQRVEDAAGRLAWFGRDSNEVLSNLGVLYERAGRVDAALRTYRRVVELDGVNPLADNRIAWLLVSHRSSDPASLREARRRAVRASQQLRHQNLAVLFTLTAVLSAEGHTEQARSAARRALQLARERGDRAFEARVRRQFDELL